MRSSAALIVLGALAGPSFGHGSQPPPPPPPLERMPVAPRFPAPPPPPTPDPAPTPGPGYGPTGPSTPPPAKKRPTAPTPAPQGPMPRTPPAPTSGPPKSLNDLRTGRRLTAATDGWRFWWEYNREYLVGRRGLLRDAGPVTGPATTGGRDPLGVRRAEVLAALRETASAADDRTLRAAAILALGRMGTDEDALRFLRLLHDREASSDVREATAVALGIIPLRQKATATAVREHLAYVMRYPQTLPDRARGMAILAAGLRSRSDALLRMQLVGRAAAPPADLEEVTNLAFACGLAGDPVVAPELMEAARKGRLGEARLSDVGRSHAVLALGLTGDGNVIGTLAAVLRSRRAGMHARRSAAFALGRILRERELDRDTSAHATRALIQVFTKSNDALLRGYSAIALGGAREPQGLLELRESIDHGGNADVKPYCAIALGLAARTLEGRGGKRIHTFLAGELLKTHDPDLKSALAIAVGLARAREAEETLLALVKQTGLPAPVRGAAAQGLGLLRKASRETLSELTSILRRERSGAVVEDVALALGLLGRRSVAADLVRLLAETSSTQLQGRAMLALGHLDHAAAVEPLLQVLGQRRTSPLVREFACVALGLLGDRRERDVLFDVDGFFNYHATTRATHELIRLY